MRRLLVATKNSHKTAEIRAMLGGGWEVADLSAYPEVQAPEETGATFAENAAIKAVAASLQFGGIVLSDDSGLEVDALGGAPGVRSARYAGNGATDAENRAKLLRELASAGAHGKGRTARFRCAMAVARNGSVEAVVKGAVEGMILDVERGEGGFGYDSLFVPLGHGQTFAELPETVKNRISHRTLALTQLRGRLEYNSAG